MIDSEPVPWGKGEKNPGEGSEIETETVCLQRANACFARSYQLPIYNYQLRSLSIFLKIDNWKLKIARGARYGVPIEEWPNEFTYVAL